MNTIKKTWSILLLIIGFSFATNAQVIEVTGTVRCADTKEPLIGVAIVVKNAPGIGVCSNSDGNYAIIVKKGTELVFSYLGYLKEFITADSTKIDVYLKPDEATLSEVVIVGYHPKTTISLAGSVVESKPRTLFRGRPRMYREVQSTEEYGSYKENRFYSALDEPLSTFSLDVDAASYSNIRRKINQGEMPEKDAVRIEEMINYFSYDYPQPKGEHPVNILTETTKCPWNEQNLLVRIGVKAKEIPTENLPESNFVFLIDVSGSMTSYNKLPLVKSSLKLLLNNLREKDRVAVVVYAGSAGEVLPSTSASDKQKIIDAIENLQAGGSTAGGAGIQLAYKIAEKNFIKDGNNRVILCTDGDFNVGISSTKELENLIEEKRKSGVFLTVLGYGMGNYKDNRLQTLAEKGNGNHAYIDNLQEANKVLVNEFGSTMYTVAKDVKMQVEFNPKFVNAYRLIGYESRLLNKEDFNDDTKDAGDLGAGHTVTALYEIIPAGVENNYGGTVDKLKYQKTKKTAKTDFTNSTELLTVKLRYKNPKEFKSKKLEIPVLANQIKSPASTDFNFQMAVTMFGQLLRKSDFTGNADYDKVIGFARKGLDEDKHGYRREFIRLVESVEQLEK